MKVFRALGVFAILLTSTFSYSQRLLVQYDFLNDDFKYFEIKKDGVRKQIQKPVVTRNHNVKIEVVNFNPFVYSANATYSTKTYTENPSMGFFNMISPLGMATGGSSFLSQITGLDPNASRGTGVMANQAARESYQAIESAYQTLYKAEQMVNNIDFVLNKVHRLKYNPYLPADTIKAFSHILLSSLFNQPSVETQDFLVLANEINRTVKSDVPLLSTNVEKFNQAYQQFASSRAAASGFEGEGMDKIVSMWAHQAQMFAENFDSDMLLSKLDALEIEYQSVMNTPFNFNTNDVAKGDEITVKIDFYKNIISENGEESGTVSFDELQKVKTKEIDITVKGDIKISSSLGLAFPYYSDNDDYINKDSVITSVPGDNYTPNIAAYLNFYPYTGRNVMVGGTFGVGVPISSDNKNFNFLMGFSTLFGSENRLVINFGATLGQVNKLDRGFTVGDNLGDVTSDIPTRPAYQWGGFVGISFALANIKE